MFVLTACATEQAPPVFVPAKSEIKKCDVLDRKHPHYQLCEGNDPALENAFNRYIKTGKAPNIITDGFVRFAYNANQQPIIKATPFQETVISLEPGEHYTSISSGDPSRWSYTVATSGNSGKQQQNILVKPSYPDISTNMVITTDKRIYNVRLVSSFNQTTTRSVSFWYPEDMANNAKGSASRQGQEGVASTFNEVNLARLNFNYSICSSFFSRIICWKPVRAFDDGTHTYIEFPFSLNQRDMPVLFVQEGSEQQLVNYHVKVPYFVVDKIFHTAVLVMGVGDNQQKVTVTNNSYQ